MPMRDAENNSSARIIRRAIAVVVLMLLFTCVCSVGFVNLSKTSVGLQTRDIDVSLKYRGSGSPSQVGSSPLLLDLTGRGSASAINRSCDGLSIPMGSARLYLMECTTVITP